MDIGINIRSLIIGAASFMAVFLSLSIYASSIREGMDFHRLISFPLILICGLVITSQIFKDMRGTGNGSYYLTLPASQTEKILAKYLLSLVIFLIFAFIFCYLLVFTSRIVNTALFSHTHMMFFPFRDFYMFMCFYYFVFHGLFFLGALFFSSQAGLRTFLALVFLGAAFTLIASLSKTIFFHHIEESRISIIRQLFFLSIYYTKSFFIVSGISLLLMCWVTILFRFKETEV